MKKQKSQRKRKEAREQKKLARIMIGGGIAHLLFAIVGFALNRSTTQTSNFILMTDVGNTQILINGLGIIAAGIVVLPKVKATPLIKGIAIGLALLLVLSSF